MERVEGGAAETHMALHVIGNAKLKDFPFPFAGTRVALGRLVNGEPTIVDISKYSGIEFWAKGSRASTTTVPLGTDAIRSRTDW